MEPFLLNFSFPPPRPTAEPLQPWLRRLLPMALLAVAVHGLFLAMPAPRRSLVGAGGRVPQSADDTPELLRLSNTMAEPGRLGPLTLGALPPPPSQLPLGLPAAAASGGLSTTRSALPAPPLPPHLGDAASALQLLLRQVPGGALAAADRDAVIALQRRQWWLSAAQERVLQTLMQSGVAVEHAPEDFGSLPVGAELRRLPAAVVPVLGTGDWHGHSLLGGQAALLLWRQAGSLWLLRLPQPQEGAAQTLTIS